MSDAGQREAENFLRALLGDRDAEVTGLWITLWTWPDRRARWFPANDAGAIASSVRGLAATQGVDAVYIGIGFQGDPQEETQRHPQGRVNGKVGDDGRLVATRGEAVDVIGLIGLATDVDIAGPAHTDKHTYPPDVAAGRRVIDSMGLPPTLIVDSGHGLQPWWLFTEPVIFGQVDQDDDGVPIVDPERVDADRERYKELLWSWTTTMRVNARSLGGWFIDPTGDMARVLRAPGSANRKVQGDARRVTVIEHDPGATYNPDDFAPYILDPRVLAEMRMAGNAETSGALEGVDVHAVWARVRSAAYAEFKHFPPWLRDMIEVDKDFGGGRSRLEDTFLGRRPDLGGDESGLDASLTRQLADLEIEPEMIVEAVMCRRVRSGVKVDKVDPSRRLGYLTSTVGRFIVESQRKRDEAAARAVTADEAFDEALTTARAEALPTVAGTVDERSSPPPSVRALGVAEGFVEPAGSSVEGTPVVVEGTPVVVEGTPVVVEGTPGARVAPAIAGPERNLVDEVSDGGDGGLVGKPAPPGDAEAAMLKKISVLLALPTGYSVWRVEYKRTAKADQARMMVMRTAEGEQRVDQGWKVGSTATTGWHPKSAWEKGPEITAHLRRDLHVFCGPPAKAWMAEGLPLMYACFHEIRIGTPREAFRAAVRDFLFTFAPVSSMSRARDISHPWLVSEASGAPPVVKVPVVWVRRQMIQMGEATPPTPEEVITIAAAMGCEVCSGAAVVEDHRTIRDSRVWLTIAPGLLTEGEWSAVRDGIESYREQQAAQNVVPIKRNVG